ncbi:MAG: SNF7 family protein [Candidatus Heimdallarchaeota archaeon]|nr:SNF7 family protein [Candidatus Heimdallarchaeota archaeon]MDH5644840.1 SNF7 family protein [Candidatus Heimdallarchaeota archaeon]
MGIKNWLFGKESGEDKEAEAIAKLKKQLNALEVEGKNLLRKSEEQKELARKMLKSGNKVGAKQALTRSHLFLQRYNQNQNTSLNLSTQIDTISTAKSTVETMDALKVGSSVVEETLQKVSPVDVERTMVEMEDQRERISMMTESLSDISGLEMDLDGDFADSIDDELAAMELDMQSESHGSLPTAGSVKSASPISETVEEESDTSDLEDELKKLQKQLEGKD